MIVTLLILIILEVLITAGFPAIGLKNFRISFSILIALYIAFKVESPFNAVLIMIVHLCHSLFSVESWEMGTFAGVLVSVIVQFVKEMIRLESFLTTAILVQIFQMVWIAITSLLYYIKLDNTDFIFFKLQNFVLESIVTSLLAPFIFVVLDKVWSLERQGLSADN